MDDYGPLTIPEQLELAGGGIWPYIINVPNKYYPNFK